MIIAFTGHRPNKLGGFKVPNPMYLAICKQIAKALDDLNPTKCITGMALGIDQWAANICHIKNIPFTAAIPFVGQESRWPKESQEIYKLLLDCAADQVIVSPGSYSAEKMQIRNQWMVDNSDHLICIWDGTQGGTGNCVAYAEQVKKPMTRIDPTKLIL